MRTAILLLASAWVLALMSPAAHAQFSIFYEGNTGDSPMTWTRPALEPGPDCVLSTEGVNVPYQVQGLITHAEESDYNEVFNYTTWHEVRFSGDFDGVLLVYKGAFDPTNPCDNLIAQTDEALPGDDAMSRTLYVLMEAYVEYYLVTTGYTSADAGPYTNFVESGIWDADLELIGPPDFADLEWGLPEWSRHWYIFPDAEEECQSVYSGYMELSELPQFVEAFAFEVNLSGYYDVGYIAGGDRQYPLEFTDSKIYLYDGSYNRMRPCDGLYARTNNRGGGGYYYSAVDYALADDIWLEAGRTYVAVGQALHDLEVEDYSPYDYTSGEGWGPSGAVVTDLDVLPPLDLELDVLTFPAEVMPGSTVNAQVYVANNTDQMQQVDAWVELRAVDSDWAFAPYDYKGNTPPDAVRIPKRFEGTVNYALSVPKGLSADEIYLATFALGTYGVETRTGDIVEFEVNEGTEATGVDAWQLRRLSALVGETEEEMNPAALDGAYPNPFHPATTIRFTLDAEARVTLAVYDVTGREVTRLLGDAELEAGTHTAHFDATGLSSGVYIYRLDTGAAVTTGRLTLLR